MIVITLQYHGIGDPDGLTEIKLPSSIQLFEDEKSSANHIFVWDGPLLKSGLFENIIEWIGRLDVTSSLRSESVKSIVNFIWSLITRGRAGDNGVNQSPNQTGEAQSHSEVSAAPAHFAKAVKVKILVTNKTRRIEIDAGTISHEMLRDTIEKCFNDTTP